MLIKTVKTYAHAGKLKTIHNKKRHL